MVSKIKLSCGDFGFFMCLAGQKHQRRVKKEFGHKMWTPPISIAWPIISVIDKNTHVSYNLKFTKYKHNL